MSEYKKYKSFEGIAPDSIKKGAEDTLGEGINTSFEDSIRGKVNRDTSIFKEEGSAQDKILGRDSVRADRVTSVSNSMLKKKQAALYKEKIKEESGEAIKRSIIRHSGDGNIEFKAKRYLDDNEGKDGIAKGLLKKAVQQAEGGSVDDEDFSTEIGKKGGKQAYTTGKYAALAGYEVIRASAKNNRYTKKIETDKKAGFLSPDEARHIKMLRDKKTVDQTSTSLKKMIRGGVAKEIENLSTTSEDIGLQALMKTKDAAVNTKRVVDAAKTTGRVAATGAKGAAKVAKTASNIAADAARYVASAAKKAAAGTVSGTSIATGGIVLLGAILIVVIVIAIMSIVPTISLKSEEKELAKTYKYITELDAKFTQTVSFPEDTWIDHGMDVTYYINGTKATPPFVFETNADLILLYLDSKYGTYYFEENPWWTKPFEKEPESIDIPGATEEDIPVPPEKEISVPIVKDELKLLHSKLCDFVAYERLVEYNTISTDGSSGTATKTVVDVHITFKSFDSYLYENMDELLPAKDAQERMSVLRDIGMYTAKIELDSPFEKDGYFFISKRWGHFYDRETKGVVMNTGIDIPKTITTTVCCTMPGTVEEIGNNSEDGHYVIVSRGAKQTIYKNLASLIEVEEGQAVKKGDIIGYVGTTGTVDEALLHFEYNIDAGHVETEIIEGGAIDNFFNRFNTNPTFYLKGASYTSASGNGSDRIVQVALSQLGNKGDRYWNWYGDGIGPDNWCAMFVSWCANQCGYIPDVFGKFASCSVARDTIFDDNGQWIPAGSYIPKPGDLIFFGTRSTGNLEHVGIVVSCDGLRVYTVEGNSIPPDSNGNNTGLPFFRFSEVVEGSYSLGSEKIVAYATPDYPNEKATEETETVDETE